MKARKTAARPDGYEPGDVMLLAETANQEWPRGMHHEMVAYMERHPADSQEAFKVRSLFLLPGLCLYRMWASVSFNPLGGVVLNDHFLYFLQI